MRCISLYLDTFILAHLKVAEIGPLLEWDSLQIKNSLQRVATLVKWRKEESSMYWPQLFGVASEEAIPRLGEMKRDAEAIVASMDHFMEAYPDRNPDGDPRTEFKIIATHAQALINALQLRIRVLCQGAEDLNELQRFMAAEMLLTGNEEGSWYRRAQEGSLPAKTIFRLMAELGYEAEYTFADLVKGGSIQIRRIPVKGSRQSSSRTSKPNRKTPEDLSRPNG